MCMVYGGSMDGELSKFQMQSVTERAKKMAPKAGLSRHSLGKH